MIYTLAGGVLFVIGLHGLFARGNLVMRIMSANVAAAGTFLIIVSASGHEASVADPVAQAIVLTGIVIAVSVTAFALSLVRRLDSGRSRGVRHGGH
ncbi:MAG: NADH-quinone oxidoreductase subunit K [Alphaproteobacteria bacterium]|nr:NADH-quinone oxidoreductase subunit K [Alphaproteobacteria bacterium]MBF0334639.1 NADH-quinone oxidoreductase subunit K [Alphaproteobacteria bacterium]